MNIIELLERKMMTGEPVIQQDIDDAKKLTNSDFSFIPKVIKTRNIANTPSLCNPLDYIVYDPYITELSFGELVISDRDLSPEAIQKIDTIKRTNKRPVFYISIGEL